MNDVSNCEAMLYSQAHALQAIFVDSLLQATKQEWFSNSEAHMRLALKAQSNCRATLETLATIKNPLVVFARQANIAQGPQQVNNNGMMPAGEPRAGAGETEKPQNELGLCRFCQYRRRGDLRPPPGGGKEIGIGTPRHVCGVGGSLGRSEGASPRYNHAMNTPQCPLDDEL
jgi:hypothetical protein